MKRFFAIFLLCVFTLVCLSACGSDDVSTEVGDGILSSFSAESLEGEICDQSVLKGKKVTMVNVWGTFCGPCISEMPDLGKLHEKYADSGFQVVGIAVDITDMNLNKIPKKVAEAKEIVETTGADYLHLIPSSSLNDALLADVQAVPLTVFVDENGNQIGTEYLGSRSMAEWESIIVALLESIK